MDKDNSIYMCVYIYTHTKEYYSAKEKAVMPFAATWMDLEMIILSKVSQKDKYYITHMWNLKYDRDEFIYETETDSQTWRTG